MINNTNIFRLTAVLSSLFAVLLLFPGFMSTDSVWQILQAKEGIYNDWHPPMMAYLWGGLNHVVTGPFLMLLVQVGLLWYGMYLLLKSVPIDEKYRPYVLVFVLLFPPVFSIMGAIWKDIQMAAWLMLAIGVIARFVHFQYLNVPERDRKDVARLPYMAGVTVMLIIVVGMRYNAIAGILPVVFVLIFSLLDKVSIKFLFRIILSAFVSCIAVMAIYAVSKQLSNIITDSKMYPAQSTMLFDLAGTSVFANKVLFGKEIGEAFKSSSNQRLEFDLIRRHYDPKTFRSYLKGGVFSYTSNNEEVKKLRNTWIKVIRENPTAYLTHRWSSYRYQVGIDTVPRVPLYMTPIRSNSKSDALRTVHNYELSSLQRMIKRYLTSITDTIIFRPYAYILLSFFTIVAGLYYWRRDHGILFMIAGSGLCHAGLLFFLAPAVNFRYSHWTILCASISLMLFIGYLLSADKNNAKC